MIVRRYAKASGALVAQAIIGLLVLGALARLLGPEDFGLNVLLTSVVTIGGVVVAAGAQAAILVMAASSPQDRPRVHGAALGFSVGAGIVLFLVGLAAAEPLAVALSSRVSAVMIVMTFVRIAPATYAGLVYSGLSGAGSIGWMGIVSVAGAISTVAAPIGAAAVPDPLAGAVAGGLLGAFAWALVALFVGARHLGIAMPKGDRLWRRLFGIALPLHLGTIAYWLMLRADTFVVNAMIGGVSVGQYGLALSLAERVGFVTSPIYNATASLVSGADRAVAVRTMLVVVKVELVLATVLTLVTMVLAPFIVGVVGGAGYAPAAAPLTALVLGGALLPIWPTVGLLLVAQTHDAWLTARVQASVALAAIVGYVFAVSRFGILGAAAVSTGSYVLLVVIGLWLAARRTGFTGRDLLPSASDVDAARTLLGRRFGPASQIEPRVVTEATSRDDQP